MRSQLVAPLLAGAALLSGCGGQAAPKLQHDDAAQLIALTNRIASEDACAQSRDIAAVSSRAIQLVNQGRVPAKLQEPLLAGVNSLAAHHPTCVQPAQSTPAVAEPKPRDKKPHGHPDKHGKHGKDD